MKMKKENNRLEQSQKSVTSFDKDWRALENRINNKWTDKLTVIVDKIASLIKRQELKIVKLQKKFKAFVRED